MSIADYNRVSISVLHQHKGCSFSGLFNDEKVWAALNETADDSDKNNRDKY